MSAREDGQRVEPARAAAGENKRPGAPSIPDESALDTPASRMDVELLRKDNEKLRLQVDALRGDFGTQLADLLEELRIYKEACKFNLEEADSLRRELQRTRNATRDLKSQNLKLQYHLNSWGIPVSNGSGEDMQALESSHSGAHRFFPPVVPISECADPAPIVLRGDLGIFHLPSLLGFLENNNLVGVLTVINGATASKLFIENGSLRLAAWNNRSPEVSLSTLLENSEILSAGELLAFREERLYDLEAATRLLYEGKIDPDTVKQCLKEHSCVIVSQLFQARTGVFSFQLGRPSFEKTLQFRLSITDLLLRTATRLDEETKSFEDPSAVELPDCDELKETT
jgi:hypothetical protein